MCDTLVWSFDAIKSINWIEFVKTLAAVATTVIAFFALRNWQRQDRAKREAEFLDALIEATHAYITEMQKPIWLLETAQFGMASHVSSYESDTDDGAVHGAIAFIEKNGEQDGRHLVESLIAVERTTITLRSLAAKGQVFKFGSYVECQNAIAMLTSHFDRIGAFSTVIRSTTWNWENPELLKLLRSVMAIKPNDIRTSIKASNIVVMEFAGQTYKRIYG